MYCKNCGKEITEHTKYCDNCGCSTDAKSNNLNTEHKQTDISEEKVRNKCLPAFILGLIASIFGMLGGLCMTMCTGAIEGISSSLYPSNSLANLASTFAFIFIFCGSIVGLIGACLCLNKVLKGSILQIVAALMIIIYAYGMAGAEFMTILSMLLFLAGGIIGIVFWFMNVYKK